MITQMPAEETLEEWKALWRTYQGKLRSNRKSGGELLDYLKSNYVLTEIFDKAAMDAIIGNVIENQANAEKLAEGQAPVPRAFFLENAGKGECLYRPENKDPVDLWGGEITRIFVGIDLASGFYMVEGSTMLWDALCAFCGVDEKDLQNYVTVAQYVCCLKRFGKLQTAADE